jgi:hypothetical protein
MPVLPGNGRLIAAIPNPNAERPTSNIERRTKKSPKLLLGSSLFDVQRSAFDVQRSVAVFFCDLCVSVVGSLLTA